MTDKQTEFSGEIEHAFLSAFEPITNFKSGKKLLIKMWTLYSAGTDLDTFAQQVRSELDDLDIEVSNKIISLHRELQAVRESKSRVPALRAACRKTGGEEVK